MSEFGLDDELMENTVPVEKNNVVTVPKRRPFYEWEVGGHTYKLKLGTAVVCKLEEKFRTNLLNVISGDGIPPLGVMLTIIQGAMTQYQHGFTYSKVQTLYDAYTDDGGNQVSFFTDVLMGTMAASGFFTAEQAEELTSRIKAAEQMM